jgi:hypothetical protein
VFANLNGSRVVQSAKLPATLASMYSISVSFQPMIIKYALDEYVSAFTDNLTARDPKTTPHHYKPHVYENLGL